eukprot:TRINITY_DN14819_c0_g1_i1.p1 TRINITY_DN14819_c0_g1~~TRINITY_DN14819_c0_g1_i1.p1  ORF type:complete len:405 (-),score=41.24 TRINITY_DN14819_c0_g1_i1:141-1355(-)
MGKPFVACSPNANHALTFKTKSMMQLTTASSVVPTSMVGDTGFSASIRGGSLRWISLSMMTMQATSVIVFTRLSWASHHEGPMYLPTTAVVLTESLKLTCCLVLFWFTSDSSRQFADGLLLYTLLSPYAMMQIAVPSLCYTVQNNLFFVGSMHLTTCTFQVTSQLKIVTTTVATVTVFGLRFSQAKWLAMVMLTTGVALVVLAENEGDKHAVAPGDQVQIGSSRLKSSMVIGFFAVILMCCTSACGSVCLECILKSDDTSVWIRNIQMALIQTPLALFIALVWDGHRIAHDGFMHGYTPLTWVVIVCHAIGGIVVSMVLRHADNILKCFASAFSIIITFLFSWLYLGELKLGGKSVSGIVLVLVASFVYGDLAGRVVGEKQPLKANAGQDGLSRPYKPEVRLGC